MAIKTKDNLKKDYRTFIDALSLESAEIIKVKFDKKENFQPPAELNIKEETNCKILDKEKGIFAVYNGLNLIAIQKGESETGLEINVVYKFTYKNSVPLTKEISEIFAIQSFKLHAWPYFRQFIQDMIARASLPPLTLDVMRINTKSSKEKSAEKLTK
jgi:preprotein translocase subunit SecB